MNFDIGCLIKTFKEHEYLSSRSQTWGWPLRDVYCEYSPTKSGNVRCRVVADWFDKTGCIFVVILIIMWFLLHSTIRLQLFSVLSKLRIGLVQIDLVSHGYCVREIPPFDFRIRGTNWPIRNEHLPNIRRLVWTFVVCVPSGHATSSV